MRLGSWSLFQQRGARSSSSSAPSPSGGDPGGLPESPQTRRPLLQPLAQGCHPRVTQGVGGEVQAPQVLAAGDHRAQAFAAGGSEAALHQPAKGCVCARACVQTALETCIETE